MCNDVMKNFVKKDMCFISCLDLQIIVSVTLCLCLTTLKKICFCFSIFQNITTCIVFCQIVWYSVYWRCESKKSFLMWSNNIFVLEMRCICGKISADYWYLKEYNKIYRRVLVCLTFIFLLFYPKVLYLNE